MSMELHVFKSGQASPFPFVTYDTENLADAATRSRVFTFWRGKPGFDCKLVDRETGGQRRLDL